MFLVKAAVNLFHQGYHLQIFPQDTKIQSRI